MAKTMAIFSTLAVFTLALIPPSATSNLTTRPQTRPLTAAIEEMQRANYYAFVMLLNMAPPDKLPQNITFLMPNNRVLAKTLIPPENVLGFLLRHSIPASLGFDALRHFPAGSMIPSSDAGFMLNVSKNEGWRRFFLNHVRTVHPNVCGSGYSVRCHGIDGVLLNDTLRLTPVAPPPAPPPRGRFSSAPQLVGVGPGPRSSGMSSRVRGGGWVECFSKLVLLSMVWSYL